MNSTRTGTVDTASMVPETMRHGTQNTVQGTRTGTLIVPARVPEPSHYPPSLDTAQQHHAILQDGGLGEGVAADDAQDQQTEDLEIDLPISSPALPATVDKGALERKPPERLIFYPALFDEFGNDPEIIETVRGMHSDRQGEVAKRLAMKGRDAALSIILLTMGRSAA